MATDPWSHYWDYDRDRLLADETIWVEWLERRFEIHIMAGLRKILNELNAERGWALIFGHTVFGAIEGLSSFAYSGGNDGDKFKQFCSDYLLPNPCPWPNLSEAMYYNFRCGLAHGFGIEKGGLTFKEDVPSPEPVTVDGDSFWIDPQWLYQRLERASGEFFRQATIRGSRPELSLRERFRWFLSRTSMQPPRKRI